ncbi:hypothetical protein EGI31_09605 [Lacihabitans soyangensis]|uniref:Porin n=2 Tax=Lacihabitans soyangensis TaxID=869394 RepID=A0AAE3H222_9BACT|nr:hypothetical protein [Lacihabitans soyangensis]
MKKMMLATYFVAVSTLVFAQKKGTSTKMTFGKGVQFASEDSLFTLGINGRVQSLFEGKVDLNKETFGADFLLRRARLNFQGTALNPKFTYRIQIGFAHGDITSANADAENNLILRDAMLNYQAAKWLKIGFGQTKLPGNRQRQVSSANLQLVERSVVNNNFTLDRDKGIWFYTNFKFNKTILKPTLAISSGEGRIVSNKNGKLSYTLRTEILPLGEFKNNGDYVESSLEFEPKPKLAVAGVYSYNQASVRTMGQLGNYLYNSATSDIKYYGGDLLFKVKGFSFESELYRRESSAGVIINAEDTRLKNHVIAGTGFLMQSGYLITKKDEIAVRYGQITPDEKMQSVMNKQQEYVLGYSHYFAKHSLKIQTDATYWVNGTSESLIYRLSSVVTF